MGNLKKPSVEGPALSKRKENCKSHSRRHHTGSHLVLNHQLPEKKKDPPGNRYVARKRVARSGKERCTIEKASSTKGEKAQLRKDFLPK